MKTVQNNFTLLILILFISCFSLTSGLSQAIRAYNQNGNLIVDPNKNVEVIYNLQNLPVLIKKSNGYTLKVTYDGDGLKTKQALFNPNGEKVHTKHYVSGMVYLVGDSSSQLESLNMEDVLYSQAEGLKLEYKMLDQLGSERLRFTYAVNGVQVVDQKDFYPFGMTQDKPLQEIISESIYGYNGKELVRDLDLDWSDYGARWYDASIARWNTVDPLAELYKPMSAYHYALNNPVTNIDPNGMNSKNVIQKAWDDTPEGGRATFDGSGDCDCGCEGKPPCDDEGKGGNIATGAAKAIWDFALSNTAVLPQILYEQISGKEVPGYADPGEGEMLAYVVMSGVLIIIEPSPAGEVTGAKNAYRIWKINKATMKITSAKWGLIKKYGTSAMEHIAEGHFHNTRVINVGGKKIYEKSSRFFEKFSNIKSVKQMVNTAIAKGNHYGKGDNYKVVHKFENYIGTTMNGKKTKTMLIYFDKSGNVRNAYPISNIKFK